MAFYIIPIENVDIPFVNFQATQPGIQRFSASAIILSYELEDLSNAKVLLCQRSPNGKDDDGKDKKNSWPRT